MFLYKCLLRTIQKYIFIKDKKTWESRYTWTDGYDDEQDVEELYKNFKRRGVFIKDGPRLYTAGLSFIGMTEFISGFFMNLFLKISFLITFHRFQSVRLQRG